MARTAACSSAGSSSAAPASASAPIASPFQLARIFSSRKGFGRFSRASNRARRARSSGRDLRAASGVSASDSTVAPVCSKLPCASMPQTRFAARAASTSSASTASTCAGVHTKKRPSSPSLSASCVAYSAPSGEVISRARYAAIARAVCAWASSRVARQPSVYSRSSSALS